MNKMNRILMILITVVFLSGCGPSLSNYYTEINNCSIKKDYKKAGSLIESNKEKVYGSKSELLYLLDKGYFLHLSGDYEESNKSFEQAKRLYDDYFTKSITNKAATLLVNDKIQPYYGEDFEISMLYVCKILNYLSLNQVDEAAVEARAASFYLKTLTNNNYSKKVYKDDAFLQYLTGLIFEMTGEYNDAYISYRQALSLYNAKYFVIPQPQDLYNSTIDMAKKLGFYDYVDDLSKKYASLSKNYKPADKNKGELIVLHYDGLVPHRISFTFELSFWKGWANVNAYQATNEEGEDLEKASKVVNAIASDEIMTVSLPKYIETPYTIDSLDVKIKDMLYPAADVSGLGTLTLQNFDDKKGGIYAKSFARAAIKFAVVRAADKVIENQTGQNSIASFVLKKGLRSASSLTEDADKRTWRVLPDKIKMVRIPLDPGTYSTEFIYKTKTGLSKTENIDNIDIKKNLKKFVVVQTVE